MGSAWYEESFQEDYLTVYKHRDQAGAEAEVKAMSEWLRLPEGAKVLDLCCGSGRHSVVLDRLGYNVTGVCLSETLLREAKKASAGGAIRWVRGDMRNVPLDGPYDAVFNMFTSFGYFDEDEENRQVLKQIHRLLRSGGRFVIDFMNPGYVRERLVPHSVRSEGNMVIDERRSIEGGYVIKRIRITESGGPERVYKEQVRLYELSEFRDMLAEAELRLDQVYGNYDGQPYDDRESPRIIMIGTKE